VSYCILALIGVSSIGVFWMVGLHRQQERRRRLKRAKRAFSSRWQSVTSSLGYAAAAGIVMQRSARSGNGSAKEASFARTASLALHSRRAQGQAGQQPGAPALLGSPLYNSPADAAVIETAQQQQQQQPALPPASTSSAAAGVGNLPQLPLEAAASEVAARHQLLGLALPQQPEGPRTGGMGVVSGSSKSSGGDGSSEDSGGESHSSGGGGLRTKRQSAAAAALASAADAEEEGGGSSQRRKLARWRRRVLCCLCPVASQAKDTPGTGAVAKPGWLRLQWLKLRLMKEEMRDNQDYAMYVAMWIDRHIFWATLVGFLIAVILIFSIQSTYQPVPVVA
ncbi:hypothetical protein ABPG77_001198, partial [Micractinium sp. CCAP 211/92]